MDAALITGIYFRDPLETWGSCSSISCRKPTARWRSSPRSRAVRAA